jgi:hypothetical protein
VEENELVRDRKGIEKGSELQMPEYECCVRGEDPKLAKKAIKKDEGRRPRGMCECDD